MTDTLPTLLDTLGWSGRELARQATRDGYPLGERHARRMLAGEAHAPAAMWDWLVRLAEARRKEKLAMRC